MPEKKNNFFGLVIIKSDMTSNKILISSVTSANTLRSCGRRFDANILVTW